MIRCVKHKATATRLCKGLSVTVFYTMLLAMPCFGQQGWVKSINSGAAMTRFWNGLTSANNNYYFQAAPFAGVQIARVINNTLTLAGELNYDIINSKKDGLFPLAYAAVSNLPPAGIYYAYVTNSASLHYLSFAAITRFYFASRFAIYIEGGPFAALRVYSRAITTGKSLIYTSADAKQVVVLNGSGLLTVQSIHYSGSMHSEISAINAGGCTGVGIVLPGHNQHYSIGLRYTFGIANITMKKSEMLKTDQVSIRLSYTW